MEVTHRRSARETQLDFLEGTETVIWEAAVLHPVSPDTEFY